MPHSVLGTDPFNNSITIEQQQRRQGLYIIGSTGRGKTVLLENLIMQEITQGIGICVLDPHRDLTRRIIELMPVNRLQDVILLDIANNDYAFGLNLYSSPTQSVKDVQYAIERIMHIWERLFNISRLTPQMVQYMRKCAETLIPNAGYTMAEIPMLFDDIPFRNKLLANVTDPNVLRFWQRYDNKPKIDKSRETEAILNKLDEFLTGMVIPIVGQSRSTLDFRTLMDVRPGKIILIQLDPNLDSITSLIGSMIVAMVRNAAFSRENILQNKRKHFSVYADEFDRFATLDFKSIMDECRKYGIAATIAHQTRDVLHREIPGLVRSTLQGNLVVFQITSPDAEELAGNFDTTPPPPQPEEKTRRAIQTPVRNQIVWLLSGAGRTHSSSVVNGFINKWILSIVSNLLSVPYPSVTRTDALEIVKQQIAPLDVFLHQVIMEKRNNTIHPDNIPIPFEMIVAIAQPIVAIEQPFGFRTCFLFCQDLYPTLSSMPKQNATHGIFIDGIPETFDTYGRDIICYLLEVSNVATEFPKWEGVLTQQIREFYKRELVTYVKHLCATLRLKGQVEPVGACCYTPQLAEIDNQALIAVRSFAVRSYRVEDFPWSQFSERMLKEKSCYPWLIGPDPGDLSVRQRTFYPNLLWKASVEGDWVIVPGQEHQFYTQQALEAEAWRLTMQVQPEIQKFKNFLIDLREVMRVFAEYPIEEDSGRQEIVMGHGLQLTSAEMINRIANQLSGLSVLHAYTRVGGDVQACSNCGTQPTNPNPHYCQPCGKKLKPEYHLTITPSSQGLPKRVVDARIATIVQANVRDGYLRKRSDVLAEIQARQQPPPPPAAPQPAIPPKPPPPPAPAQQAVQPPAQPKPFQAPPPLPQARRKVPKQKVCPDCSQPNDPAANFCMKCGKKL